ncbi:HipA N-terminal domain-containing protein [Clostridium estertheticum]|uniref:HipA N-terminal domain-containing protein n=1 Tax=Clostridium estertheticum TaxID=238834 RepID=A0AA47I4U3_9CLOT|nr:HipA N-terminal domain-containing protein [Clostridium estertheticum]MBU3156368.1 HipA N-terminal domain-containing protein [Clostridium estertheticum]MBU3178896.1 HipA N-terminal domain-containing protein [Clostridium estertheticum]WAG59632.1 HipA N-terminal domain-containing protein [Clostridium estertheticum]
MTCKSGITICMMWKNKEGESFKVGELSKKTGKYYFKYDINGVESAKEYGFCPLPYFPKVDAKYFREELFRTFSNRLPGHAKKDKTSILKEYGLEKYDDFELLKKIGDKMLNDNIEFISPFGEEKTVLDEEHNIHEEEHSALDEK